VPTPSSPQQGDLYGQDQTPSGLRREQNSKSYTPPLHTKGSLGVTHGSERETRSHFLRGWKSKRFGNTVRASGPHVRSSAQSVCLRVTRKSPKNMHVCVCMLGMYVCTYIVCYAGRNFQTLTFSLRAPRTKGGGEFPSPSPQHDASERGKPTTDSRGSPVVPRIPSSRVCSTCQAV